MDLLIPLNQISKPSDIRTINEIRVLELFKKDRKLSAADIIKETGISKPTVMKILQQLCARGTIRMAGVGQSSRAGGKKPELFIFADERKILCINFWPQETTVFLSPIVGEMISAEKFKHDLGDDLDKEILWISVTVEKFLRKNICSIQDLYGAVITTSGIVDFNESILHYNSQAPQWGSNVHLKGYLDQIFGPTVKHILENSGKAAGRGYLAANPEMAQKRVLTLFTTWGVSGCFIDNGKVLNGKDFLIGEIGHMTVEGNIEEICGCGRKGCLEQMVSIGRVRKMAEKMGTSWYRSDQPLNFEQLFSYSRKGDEDARKIVKMLAHWFSVMLHNITIVYNPEVIVFQGNFAQADGFFDSCLRAELSTFRYVPQESVQICYDRTSLELRAAEGGVDMMKKKYFDEMYN